MFAVEARLKLSWRMSGTSRPYFLAPNARKWPLEQSSKKVRWPLVIHSCLHIGLEQKFVQNCGQSGQASAVALTESYLQLATCHLPSSVGCFCPSSLEKIRRRVNIYHRCSSCSLDRLQICIGYLKSRGILKLS